MVNGTTATGATALHLAAARGTPAVVELLLTEAVGIEVNATDGMGKTALDRAVRSNRVIADMLREHGGWLRGPSLCFVYSDYRLQSSVHCLAGSGVIPQIPTSFLFR